MTEEQKVLKKILKDENNKACLNGQIYLKRGDRTINALVQAAPPEAVQEFLNAWESGLLEQHYERAQEMNQLGKEGEFWSQLSETAKRQDPSGRVSFLVSYLYVSGPELKARPFRDAFQAAMADLVQGTARFYLLSQTKEINAIYRVLVVGPVLDVNGGAEISVINIGGSKYQFQLRNAARHRWVPVRLFKLLDALLMEHHRQGPNVSLPIADYAELIGKDISTKAARDQFRKDIRADLDTLADFGWYKGADRIGLGGNVHTVTKEGVIHWEWGSITSAFMGRMGGALEISAEVFRAEGNAYLLGRYIDLRHRTSEEKTGGDTNRIRTLLSVTTLPSVEQMREQGNGSDKRVRERVMVPFFEALDSFDHFGYDVYTKDGRRVEDPLAMTAEEFLGGYIVVDYSEYATHPDRVRRRREHAAKARKKKDQKKGSGGVG